MLSSVLVVLIVFRRLRRNYIFARTKFDICLIVQSIISVKDISALEEGQRVVLCIGHFSNCGWTLY